MRRAGAGYCGRSVRESAPKQRGIRGAKDRPETSPTKSDDITVVYCDANGIAESIGNPKGANVAILGSTLAKAPVTSVESMMEAIRIELGEKKAKFLEGNKKALIAGMEAAK